MQPYFIFAFLGIVTFLIGVGVTFGNRKNWRRRQRILQTPTTPIAQAPGHSLVEIKGRVVPSEQGLLYGPFSGRQAVFCRVVVEELRSSGKSSYWHTIINEVDGRTFMIDDGSGQQARVEARGANVILDRQNIASSGTFNDAPPQLEAFLSSRGLKSTGFFGFNKSMRYQEEILAPGDPVYALGPSRREAGPPVADAYRMAPGSQLVMFAGGGDENELLLTNKSEEELTSNLLRGFYSGIAIAVVGVLMTVVCSAVAFFSMFELAI